MKKMISNTCLVAMAAVALSLAGCKSTDDMSTEASMGAMNETCPIGNRAVNPEKTAAYGGSTVGFCCDNCLGKFNGMTDTEKANVIAGMKKN